MIRFGLAFDKPGVVFPPEFARFIAPAKPRIRFCQHGPVINPTPTVWNLDVMRQSIENLHAAGITDIFAAPYFLPAHCTLLDGRPANVMTAYECDGSHVDCIQDAHGNDLPLGQFHVPTGENGEPCEHPMCRKGLTAPQTRKINAMYTRELGRVKWDAAAIEEFYCGFAKRCAADMGVYEVELGNEPQNSPPYFVRYDGEDDGAFYGRYTRDFLVPAARGVRRAGCKTMGPGAYGASDMLNIMSSEARLAAGLFDIPTFHVYPESRPDEDKWTTRRVLETLGASLIGADGKEITVQQAIGDRSWEATEGGREEVVYQHLWALEELRATSLIFYDPPGLCMPGSIDPNTLKPGPSGYAATAQFQKVLDLYRGVVPRRRHAAGD